MNTKLQMGDYGEIENYGRLNAGNPGEIVQGTDGIYWIEQTN